MQPGTISAALDCVTRDEIIVRPYDGTLLRRPVLTIALGQSGIRRWFWALTSWEFFLAERTFHQVMPVYGVPRDPPPHGLSFEAMVLDDLEYVTSALMLMWTRAETTPPGLQSLLRGLSSKTSL